jgi:hypothetical protein
MVRRLDIPTLRAALWTLRALRQTRQSLRHRGLEGISVSAPPRLPREAGRGVLAILRRLPNTCLERSVVLQCWHARWGDEREIVIGVQRSGDSFKAHAWLDGETGNTEFDELIRLPARAG